MTSRRGRASDLLVSLLAVMVLGSPPAASAGSTARVTVLGNPLQAALRLMPVAIKVGGATTASELVMNLGSIGLSNVRYGLLVDTSGLNVSPPLGGATSIGALGQSTARFSVCAIRAGSYLIQAQVTASAPGGLRFTVVSPAQLLEVRPSTANAVCK